MCRTVKSGVNKVIPRKGQEDPGGNRGKGLLFKMVLEIKSKDK